MSRRPRLVHEGSPILGADAQQHGEHAADNTTTSTVGLHHWNHVKKKTHSNPTTGFKLQTKLVIGGDAAAAPANHHFDDETGLDAMVTDDAMNGDVINTQPMHRYQRHSFMHSQPQENLSHPNEYASFQQQEQPCTSQIYHMPSPLTSPLVVIDGANIAYNYAESLNPSLSNQYHRIEPNPRGITIAIQYFIQHKCRVQAVVPISWYKLKPRPGDYACSAGYKGNLNQRDDAKMLTEEVEELRSLRQHGFLVACPPSDDDDAYAIALARREEERFQKQKLMLQDDEMMMDYEQGDTSTYSNLPTGGYVVSNDFFHDAVRRDERQQKHFGERQSSLSQQSLSLKSWLNHHRISYSFANVGILSPSGGEVELEFLPNPRNELIEAISQASLHQTSPS